MTREEIVAQLSVALAAKFDDDPSVQEAIAAFARMGLKVTNMSLQIHCYVTPIPAQAATATDAEFLRSLRIAPDLSVERGRE